MTSNAHGRHFLSVSSQSRKSSSWGVVIRITLLGVFLSAPAQAKVFVVNTPADPPQGDAEPGDGICETAHGNGVCTLRAAIEEANALAGDDTIVVPGLPSPNAYVLTIVSELTITSNLTITGGGAAATIIDGNQPVRPNSGVLKINSPATVSISGVTIQNGARKTTPFNTGGGIYNDGTLQLTNSIITGNKALFAAGIYNRNSGTLTLTNSTVSDNEANFDGGGIFNNGIMTLIKSTVSGNSAIQAGGIFNGGTMTLINSTVSGNSVSNDGGGIYNDGTLTLTNSTVSRNFGGDFGGGIRNFGKLTLTNSTVSRNSTVVNGAGIHHGGDTVNLFNATITNNELVGFFSGSGAGVFVSGGALNFQNTIIAKNSALAPFTRPADCEGAITSNGNNLIQSPGGCTVTGGGVTEADPLLDSNLQDNGGPTQTHALLAGSPAIDAGNSAGCRDQFGALLTTDQRGFPRSIDGNNDGVIRCDIGAYEVFTGSNTNVVAALLPSSRSVQVGTAATVFGTMINTGQSIAAACSITLPTGIPATFQYQTTDPATNQVTGFPNTTANIAPGGAQSFIFAVTPSAPIAPTDVQFSFDCANTEPAPVNTGLNTLLLSASNTPVPDIVALAATTTNDGIVNIPGTNGTGAFAVATVNVGAGGSITASADTGSATLPVSISLCQTDPGTGQCISTVDTSVTTTINANATPTFGIFVQGNGNVPFDPATNRIFVRFKDGGGVTRGSTSVAVRTQ